MGAVAQSEPRGRMGIPASGPFSVFACALSHRHLLSQLVQRDIANRYRGSWLGTAWALASPALSLLVFTFIFTRVFESRWGVEIEGDAAFALRLFAGLVVFWFFADVATRSPGLLLENAPFVKRVVFPLEILPWVAVLNGLFHAALGLVVLVVATFWLGGSLPATVFWAPLMFLPLLLWLLGLSWGLAALGPYLRDLAQIVPVVVTLMLFLSPIFYPVSAIPESVRALVALNPLGIVIGELRSVLFAGEAPNPTIWWTATGLGWIVAWVGLRFFQRARRGFADVV